jgi:type IV pilus assembly protein PilC
MAFIIPRFRSIFDQFGGELPAFTRAFMGVYDMIRYNLVYIIGSLLSMVILGVLVSKTKKGHYLFCKIALALPLLGKILREAFVATFCQTMATLLNAGVSVLEILDILLAMTKNDIIKNSIIQAREQIVEGSDLSSSFSISGFFPNMVVKMIRVGEESGSLSRVLDTTSSYYERKVDALISTVLSLLEPIMIIVVGGVVLTVVLALYLPIFSMSEVAR